MLNNQIQFTTEQRSVHQQYRKYTSDNTIAYLSNGYIYVEGNQLLEYIKLRGVFEYPNEAILAQKQINGDNADCRSVCQFLNPPVTGYF